MATRTIASPGVQINELDLSVIARPTGETNVFMAGFTPQGPTDEIINIGSVTEFEDVFGQPQNAAERYLYHSARQVLNNNGNLLVSRLPYGTEEGTGFSNSYSATVYPIEAQIDVTLSIANLSTTDTGSLALSGGYPIYLGTNTVSVVTSNYYLSAENTTLACYNNTLVSVITSYDYSANTVSYDDAAYLNVKSPYSILLDQDQYESTLEGGIEWGQAPDVNATITDFNSLGEAGIVVINTAKTTLNDLFEGYYLALADNSNINPSTDFDSIRSIKAFNDIVSDQYQLASTIPSSRFSFRVTALSGSYGTGSISEALENLPTQFDF